MSYLRFAAANARWLAAGLLIAFGSSFGQTFFIALFAEPLRQTFDLSHGDFGGLYMIATLASAAVLIQLGRAADLPAQRGVLTAVTLVFALVCVAMSQVASVWMLGLVIFGLRVCGQGMMGHLSQSYTARWFVLSRGRALAIAGFGFPIGEALTPVFAVAMIAAVGWRGAWLTAAAVLVLALLPVLWLLLARERVPHGRPEDAAASAALGLGLDGRAWTRAEAVRDPAFWGLMLGAVAPSFMLTVVFFLPAHIAEIKDWTLAQVTVTYSVYAGVAIAASTVAGGLIDRFSARACLPFYQLPMAIGLVGLSLVQAPLGLFPVMALLAASHGASSALLSALWAELYGVRHIGSIRSIAHAGSVFASAVGPGLVGALLDLGAPFESQLLWMAAATLCVCAGFAALQRGLNRRGHCAAAPASPS